MYREKKYCCDQENDAARKYRKQNTDSGPAGRLAELTMEQMVTIHGGGCIYRRGPNGILQKICTAVKA